MSGSSDPPRPRRGSAAAGAASRRNGAKSRGPTTDAGKRRSSQNSRLHGLRASSASILAALPDWLQKLRDRLAEEAGDTPEARRLIDRILVAEFCRHRASVMLDAAISHVTDYSTLEFYANFLGPSRWVEALARLMFPRSTGRTVYQDVTGRRPRMARLLAYERRFRGQRDRAIRAFYRALAAQCG